MIERRAQVRVWRTITRVVFGTACVIGLGVALIPGMRFEQTLAAMVLAAVGALIWMLASAKSRGVSLRRPTPMRNTPLLLLGSLAFGAALGLVIAGVLVAAYVLDLPEGVALACGIVVAGIGSDLLAAMAERAPASSLRTDEAQRPVAPG